MGRAVEGVSRITLNQGLFQVFLKVEFGCGTDCQVESFDMAGLILDQ